MIASLIESQRLQSTRFVMSSGTIITDGCQMKILRKFICVHCMRLCLYSKTTGQDTHVTFFDAIVLIGWFTEQLHSVYAPCWTCVISSVLCRSNIIRESKHTYPRPGICAEMDSILLRDTWLTFRYLPLHWLDHHIKEKAQAAEQYTTDRNLCTSAVRTRRSSCHVLSSVGIPQFWSKLL